MSGKDEKEGRCLLHQSCRRPVRRSKHGTHCCCSCSCFNETMICIKTVSYFARTFKGASENAKLGLLLFCYVCQTMCANHFELCHELLQPYCASTAVLIHPVGDNFLTFSLGATPASQQSLMITSIVSLQLRESTINYYIGRYLNL